MKYYVKCNSVFNRNNIEFRGEDDVLYFTIRHAKLPKIYGILTPASSMGTTLIDRLQNSGMNFSIISDF